MLQHPQPPCCLRPCIVLAHSPPSVLADSPSTVLADNLPLCWVTVLSLCWLTASHCAGWQSFHCAGSQPSHCATALPLCPPTVLADSLPLCYSPPTVLQPSHCALPLCWLTVLPLCWLTVLPLSARRWLCSAQRGLQRCPLSSIWLTVDLHLVYLPTVSMETILQLNMQRAVQVEVSPQSVIMK